MECFIRELVQQALVRLVGPEGRDINFQLSRPNKSKHGDLACNVALLLAKKLKKNPKDIAETLVADIPSKDLIKHIEIVAPGFINFFLSDKAYHDTIKKVLTKKDKYVGPSLGDGKKVHFEFVSVNPTGPLHVGHGRVAVYGSVLSNCLEACGYNVHREYYINDAGRQMDILGVSVFMRYLEELGEKVHFPKASYKGEYVKDIAKELVDKFAKDFSVSVTDLVSDLPDDSDENKDKYVDSLIAKSKILLGKKAFAKIHKFTLDYEISDIKDDLETLGIVQHWFSEQGLLDRKEVEKTINLLKKKDCIYEKDGALWFKASEYGDEKDRVLVKSNGHYTYFATDIAYHHHKYNQGFDKVIDVWGADHHGYIPRMYAALKALGHDETKFQVLLVQFVTLCKGKKKVQMSTRSGSFFTLRELREDVGLDATRFFYVSRKASQQMEFDLELAKSKSADNPVYYVQYAHARICSVMRQLKGKKWKHEEENGLSSLNLLTSSHEKKLMKDLLKYPDMLDVSASCYEPYHLMDFLKELANHFHAYYSSTIFLVNDNNLRDARLSLILATKQVLINGLKVLGVSAPEKM